MAGKSLISFLSDLQGWAPHSFPFSTFRSFFEFLASYETQKNVFFFSKEQKITQRTQHSFAKNVKERKERNIRLRRT